MKIVVTGGLGFIGHCVVKLLESLNHEVVIIDTLTNYGIINDDELEYLISQRRNGIRAEVLEDCVSSVWAARDIQYFQPNIIIHLASYPRQKVVNRNPVYASRVMSTGLLNLLEAAQQLMHDTRFVYISSSMVYGDFVDDVREDAPCNPKGQYGILKLAGEWLVRDYTRRVGKISHTILRPSAVYGPLDVQDRVISKFMLGALRGETLKVNGPEETLDFTYVWDAARGIVDAALSEAAQNKTYNITKSHSWTLAAAAQLAVDIAGRGKIEFNNRDPDFPSRGALNIDAARRDFGFNPRVDVADGFLKYSEWYKSSAYWSSRLLR